MFICSLPCCSPLSGHYTLGETLGRENCIRYHGPTFLRQQTDIVITNSQDMTVLSDLLRRYQDLFKVRPDGPDPETLVTPSIAKYLSISVIKNYMYHPRN